MSFNPIKESTDGKKAHAVIWSTSVIEKAIKGIEQGKKLVANPFYEKNTKLLKGDLVFEKTDQEKKEWLKCRDDIIYFANTYCKLMTPTGIRKVEMREYQEDYLRHLEKNRLSIFLSCRQSGKCVFFLSKVNILINPQICQQFKKRRFKSYYISENEYELPIFELYNLYAKGIKWRVKYLLYKILYLLTCQKEKQHQKTDGKE